ncbi:unnamed protein product [Coffea canephora]|uniref:Uncharacterized protein n=1 Tax=Coffea canephora TaxID=49390 RepID=A0A068TTI9_COFCA|nr:unnamed protein product [Coffea canephora]
MNSIAATSVILAIFFILAASSSSAVRPDPNHPDHATDEKPHQSQSKGGGGDDSGEYGGFFGPGGGFNIPGFGTVGGIIRPTVVCKEKGPCYKKKLICPAKCFSSFSRSGKGYGAGGGGGGCTMDCKKNCVAYC